MERILIIGGVSWDTIVYLREFPEPIAQTLFASGQEALGSTGAGKALALTSLQVPTTLQAVLGRDEAGEKIATALAQRSVQAVFDYDETGSERHVNLMDQHGARISLFTHASASEIAIDEQRFAQLLQTTDLIVLNIIAYTKPLLPQIIASKKPIWTDLHDYDADNPYHQVFIEAASHLFVSSDRLPNYREQMQAWIADGKTLVVCTHGGQGASALDAEGNWYEQAALPTTIVDTNGAGDSFFAGFLYGCLLAKNLQTCLQYGTICGSLAVTSAELSHSSLTPDLLKQLWQKNFDK